MASFERPFCPVILRRSGNPEKRYGVVFYVSFSVTNVTLIYTSTLTAILGKRQCQKLFIDTIILVRNEILSFQHSRTLNIANNVFIRVRLKTLLFACRFTVMVKFHKYLLRITASDDATQFFQMYS